MMMLSAVALFLILVGGVICHPEQSVIKSYKHAQIKRDLGIYLFFICDNSLLIPLKKTQTVLPTVHRARWTLDVL